MPRGNLHERASNSSQHQYIKARAKGVSISLSHTQRGGENRVKTQIQNQIPNLIGDKRALN